MLFPTPRYGAEAITTLISRANGSVMLTPSVPFPIVSEILNKRSMSTFELPSIEHFLASKPAPYPFTKTFESSRYEPLVCLHTSGTTGFPKPVIWTHDWASSLARGHYIPAPVGYERLDDILLGSQRRIMALFPPFHASGICIGLFFPLFLGTVVAHAPGGLTPKEVVNAVVDALDILGEESKVDSLALPPPHAEYMAANPTLLEKISSKVGTLLYGGGDISHSAGNTIAAQMQVFNQMASTEMGLWSATRRKEQGSTKTVEDEWRYLVFHPSLSIRFDAVSEGEETTLYEAIMVKNSDDDAWIQPLFKIFTDKEELTLGDLFTRHPHNPDKWKHSGRADDLLNFLSGETFHPGSAERRIAEHPGVAEVLVVGTRRPKASLIVRLNPDADLDEVWEVIERVNKDSPVYARVRRHMILTVTEPFPLTAKGSIRKKAVVEKYEGELDALYKEDGSFVPTK